MMTTRVPTFVEKRKQWLEALSGQDRHAILRQLSDMTWNAASYRVVNEARRLASPAPEGGVQLNGLMHSLIDKGFFTLHIVAVRRLMDTYPLEGERGVYSLHGLLRDMSEHRSLFTRQAIFDAEGLVYDYEPIRQKHQKYVTKQFAAGKKAFHVPHELFWEQHERRHKVIDALADTAPHSRLPSDTILDSVFVNLQRKAEAASKAIMDHATKFIAHAAIPESRALVKADDHRLSLNKLWIAHEQLCHVASFVSISILGDSCPGFLAIPQFDQLKYIEKPLVDSSQVDKIRRLWDDFAGDCHDWSQWDSDEYAKEFP